jgi:hypothetical protein
MMFNDDDLQVDYGLIRFYFITSAGNKEPLLLL